MQNNLGRRERTWRAFSGVLLIAIPLFVEFPDYWGLVPFLLGAALVGTAFLRYCPVKARLASGR